MITAGWSHCDIVVEFLNIKSPGTSDLPQGVCILERAMNIVPCAILEGMPADLALVRLREYINVNNPELDNEDFSLRHGWNDHTMTDFPSDNDVIFITPDGCCQGVPVAAAQ